jgi:His/Glu/Gln/Arg/opine family amino acid ABC transporter permease subunit
MQRPTARLSASLRFVATVLGLVLIFGGGTSLVLGVFDKSQTSGAAPLSDLGALFGYDVHFLQQTVGIVTTARDQAGTPFHSYLVIGLGTTLAYCFIAMPIALLLGLMLALMSGSRLRVLRAPARGYVEFFRNTPLLVQLLAIYYSLGFLGPWLNTFFPAGVATLVLNYAAYECENLRAGLAAVDRGQGEAAATLGLGFWPTQRLVILPQVIRVVIPTVINDLIYMYKDSSILSLITVTDLTEQVKDLTRRNPSLSWQIFLVGALLYLVLSLPVAQVARVAEARLRSVRVAPSRDLTATAMQVLAGAFVLGWVCSVLLLGVSPAGIASSLSQLGAALTLTALLMAFALVVLGLVVYLPGSAVRLARGRPRSERGSGEPAAAVAVRQP